MHFDKRASLFQEASCEKAIRKPLRIDVHPQLLWNTRSLLFSFLNIIYIAEKDLLKFFMYISVGKCLIWSLKLYTTRWMCASECLSGCLYNFIFVLLLSGCVRSYAQTRRDRTQFKGIPLLFYLPPPVPPCAVVWHTQGLHVYTQACNVTGVWPGGKTTESRSCKLYEGIHRLSTLICSTSAESTKRNRSLPCLRTQGKIL